MGIFDKVVTFNNQSYSTNFDACKTNDTLFVDITFQITSQNFHGTDKFTNVEWKRPGDIVSDPRLFCSSTSSIINGEASNPSLASCLTLVRRKDCLKKLIPDMETQGWVANKRSYFGIFKFRFWKCGEEVEVLIDDLLPTIDNKLICVSSDLQNEVWCALVEKAYAKLCGSYKAVYEASDEEILVDLTGGVPEMMYLDKPLENKPEDYFKTLETEYNEQTLILVKIKFDVPLEQLQGLTAGQSFPVTNVKTANVKNTNLSVKYARDKLSLIRLCCANGQKQWTGPLSELSNETYGLDAKVKIKMGISVASEGDFWVISTDILPLINCILYIRLPTLSFVTGTLAHALPGLPSRRVPSWKVTVGQEFWYGPAQTIEEAVSGKGGGGQYAFDIQGTTNTPQDVIVHLILMCAKQAQVPFSIILFEIETNRQTILFSTKWATKIQENHIDQTRSLGVYYRLAPGAYMIKAYMRGSVQEQMNYHLRLFTPNKSNGRFLWSEPPNHDTIMCLCTPEDCVLISRLRVVCITGLPWQKKYNDVFVEIDCEGLVLNSNLSKKKEEDTLRWEQPFLFYRFNLSKPINFRVFNRGVLYDTFIGKTQYHYDAQFLNRDPVLVKFPLVDKQGKELAKVKFEVAFWHTDSFVNL